VRRFTADASHQMRTPLAICGRISTSCGVWDRNAGGQSALNEVDSAINRLERLLGQLITLARADEQPRAAVVENVD